MRSADVQPHPFEFMQADALDFPLDGYGHQSGTARARARGQEALL